ncbi:membrane dipeptidase [Mesorhizobium kowhaii]|uniref:membrane dipeptidase n=1 Tax=Mesorhizobium kowhaii TaxID=1300272 RepID=UPI0035E633D0
MNTTAESLHRNAIIIDAVCPLLDHPEMIAEYRAGGLTAIAPTVGFWDGTEVTLRKVAMWHRLLRERDDLLLVRTAADIRSAKALGKMGIIMHFQGPAPIEDNLDLIDTFKVLGVGIMQLAYNVRNRLGDGCEERSDAGLSRFGLQALERMNRVRTIVDCAHTGVRTTMDAIEHSSAPVIVSHANAQAVHPSARNLSDELIKAIAAQNGTIGVVGFPGFVSDDKRPSIDRFIDHIAHISSLVGPEHVTLGIDYYADQYPYADDAAALKQYNKYVADNVWTPSAYPPPPHFFPAGIETPRTMQALTECLLRRQFSEQEIVGIYGGNLLRVYETIWGS